MAVAFKLDMPEELYLRLQERAGKLGEPPEIVALRYLEDQIDLQTEDPIAKFIGAFDTGVADLGSNHDQYIAQELLDRLRD